MDYKRLTVKIEPAGSGYAVVWNLLNKGTTVNGSEWFQTWEEAHTEANGRMAYLIGLTEEQ